MKFFQFPVLMSLAVLAVSHSASAETRNVKFRTLCFQPVDGISTLRYLKGAEAVEVEMPQMNLSKRYDCQVDREIVFGDVRTADGKTVIAPRARAVFPAHEIQEAVLLFLPSPAGSDLPFHVTVFDFDPRTLKEGETLFANLSDQAIAGMFGEQKLDLPPGAVKKLGAVKRVDDKGSYYVNIQSKVDNQWRPLCKSWWRADPTARKLALAFRDPATRRLRLFSFPDRREPTTPDPAE